MELVGIAAPAPACPACGRRGQGVPAETVRNLVRAEAWDRLPRGEAPSEWWLCPSPSCAVVYFRRANGSGGEAESVFSRSDVRVPVWFKDPGSDVPLCYCAGLTRAEVKEAVAKGCRTIGEIRETTGKTRQGHCRTENPSGRCCHPVLQEVVQSTAKSG